MKTISKYLITIVLCVCFASASAQTDEKLIRKGNRDYKRSDYTEAEVKYRKALEARPNNANAQFNLGDALFAQQNYDAAYEAFQKVVEMSPDAKLKSSAVCSATCRWNTFRAGTPLWGFSSRISS